MYLFFLNAIIPMSVLQHVFPMACNPNRIFLSLQPRPQPFLALIRILILVPPVLMLVHSVRQTLPLPSYSSTHTSATLVPLMML